ncbi:hypothetical protein FQR65_LT09715 [Abscondita terminalis]|nr:hypothetical protein FQR65_LT09715 [Abscondita terminalis]
MPDYSNEEKFDMFKIFIECRKDLNLSQNRYLGLYPERPQPDKRTFSRLKTNLIQHGSISKPKPKSYMKENKDDEEITVLGSTEANHNISTRELAVETGLSIQNILKKHKYHPYRYRYIF